MQTDVERADRLLARLADLLRASLAVSARQQTSLREEWKLLELYASIMQERFAGRVTLAWNASEEALEGRRPGDAVAAAARERLQTRRGAQQSAGGDPRRCASRGR